MGKNKRLPKSPSARSNHNHNHNPKSKSKLTRPAGISKPKPKSKSKHQAQHTAPIIPFSPSERILLIGEGDLSFARSLIEFHKCQNILATVLESEEELREKYPHVTENIDAIEKAGGRLKYGVDARKLGKVLKGEKMGCSWERVVFNFPHVGGKSTDVNRQVRYNQELLVAFFQSATPLLSPQHGASIIITLFEGSPYTLWNIRDLARHSGLEVAQSFRFQASAYPGYRHARTIGVVRGGGGWRGEERGSRSFVFVRRGEGVVQGPGKKGREESSDDESESEEGNWDGVESEKEDGEEEEEFDDVDDGSREHNHLDTLEKDSRSRDDSASDEGDRFEGFEDEDEQDSG